MARILVAEDNRELRLLLAAVLRDEGHEVVAARDGAEALKITREGEVIDLLVTDFIMPNMDGADLASALLATPPAPPVIVFTAYPPEGKLAPLVAASKVHYVSKAERVDALLARVEDLLAS